MNLEDTMLSETSQSLKMKTIILYDSTYTGGTERRQYGIDRK